MFTAINRIRIGLGGGEDLARLFGRESRIEHARGFRGVRFLGRIWSRAGDDVLEFLSISEWESEQAFEAWTETEAFARAQADLRLQFVLEGADAAVGVPE